MRLWPPRRIVSSSPPNNESVFPEKLPYWIQHADYSASEYGPVDLVEAERLLAEDCWRTDLAFKRSLARSLGVDGDYCPPGIGFVTPAGRLLHFCPDEYGLAFGSYFLTSDFESSARTGREAIDPTQVQWCAEKLVRLQQYRALQLFYRGDYDGVIDVIEGRV